MDQKKVRGLRQSLLDRLSDALNRDSIAARYQQAEEGAEPEGVITALFDTLGDKQRDAFGEIFFYPIVDPEAEIHHFACIILLAEGVGEEDYAALERLCSKRNSLAPVGAFYVDEDNGRLLYRLAVPLMLGLDAETLFEEMNAVVGNALGIVDKAMDELLDAVNGQDR